ncbi:hypothetical protein V498_06186 [Pseudogymnoascus sp. VKM F-4517 (FW-2822)]|nr:hypothetical protein V498_06186 [Pseudogymnoascus sp. VKM F-4517 (FW-2822)]
MNIDSALSTPALAGNFSPRPQLLPHPARAAWLWHVGRDNDGRNTEPRSRTRSQRRCQGLACHQAMSSSASSHSVEKEHKLVAEGLLPPSAQETDVDSVNGSDRNGKLEEAGAGSAVAKVDTKKDVEGGEKAAEEEIADPNIVGWDGPDDPENPMNWPRWKRAGNVTLVSMLTFVAPLASSMFAPGVPYLMDEFNSTSKTLASFVVSVYILGFGVGPLFLAPLSEIYGRVPVYHVTNALFVIFNVACALATDLNMLIGFRFLAGVAGSACLTIGGGTIADLIAQQRRGIAMSGFVLGPLLGPVIGPVAGGFAAESIGWRWIFYILAITTGVFSLMCLVLLKESYAPVLLARKTARLIKETGNTDLRSKLDTGLTPREVFARAIVRPMKLLVLSPIVLTLSMYMGVVYGYLYLLFTTFTVVFADQYHFSSGSIGLCFLGIGIGSLIGLVINGATSDRILKSKARKACPPGTEDKDLVFKPEYRLPPLFPASILIPAGLFIYGWTAQYKVHYIVPIFGTLLIGIGNLGVFMCIQMYMVDAFTIFAASALAANTVIRCILGAVLPLAGQDMYKTLGLGWGNSLLAFVALAFIWVPWWISVWGEKLRIKYKVEL